MNVSASSLAQRLQEAEALHQQGRLTDAENLLRAVLGVDSGNFDALSRMGALRAKQGKYEEALTYLRAGFRGGAHQSRQPSR